MDYAESEKMKSVLMLPVKNESFSFSQPSEVSVQRGFYFFVVVVVLLFVCFQRKRASVHPVSAKGLELGGLPRSPCKGRGLK